MHKPAVSSGNSDLNSELNSVTNFNRKSVDKLLRRVSISASVDKRSNGQLIRSAARLSLVSIQTGNSRLAGKKAGAECRLKIESPCVGIQIQNFSAQIQ